MPARGTKAKAGEGGARQARILENNMKPPDLIYVFGIITL